MPYFASKLYQGAKTTLGTAGAATSTIMLIYGAAGGAWYYIAGGAVGLGQSLFLLFDSSKVLADIRKEIDRLNSVLDTITDEANRLKDNVNALNDVRDEITQENRQLQESIETSQEQVEHLQHEIEKLRGLYKTLLTTLAEAGDSFSQFNTTINSSMNRLEGTQSDLDSSVQVLEVLVEKLGEQKFDDFDLNDDGLITPIEFQQSIQ